MPPAGAHTGRGRTIVTLLRDTYIRGALGNLCTTILGRYLGREDTDRELTRLADNARPRRRKRRP